MHISDIIFLSLVLGSSPGFRKFEAYLALGAALLVLPDPDVREALNPDRHKLLVADCVGLAGVICVLFPYRFNWDMLQMDLITVGNVFAIVVEVLTHPAVAVDGFRRVGK